MTSRVCRRIGEGIVAPSLPVSDKSTEGEESENQSGARALVGAHTVRDSRKPFAEAACGRPAAGNDVWLLAGRARLRISSVCGSAKGVRVAAEHRAESGGNADRRTVYLVTPVTYDAAQAGDDDVAQAFDKLVKKATARGVLDDCGVELVGHCVIQPRGDEVPLGIE